MTSIQSGAQTAVAEMGQAVVAVNSGVALAGKAGDSTREITSRADRVVQEVSGITAALKEQGAASNEIAGRVESIVRVTEENSSYAMQSARSAEALRDLAAAMQGQVARFRI